MASNAHRILGYEIEYLIGKNVMEFVHPEDVSFVGAEFSALLESPNENRTVVYRYRRSDGEYLWFETTGTMLNRVDGSPEQILFNTRDITERRLADHALRQSEAKYRLLLDHSSDLIWDLTVDGVFTYASPSWSRLTGYNPESIQGSSLTEIVHPEDIPICMEYIGELTETQTIASPVTYRVRHADGSWHWHEATGAPVVGVEDQGVSIVGVSRDITERKRTEEQIQRQLTEKEAIVKEAHHRIKNNIAQIESLLSLRAISTASAEVKDALREAISGVSSFRLLYEKLLVGEGYQDVAMKDYAEGLIDSLTAVYGERSNVTVEKRIADFRISSKKAVPLGIVLNELVTNVYKYAFGESEEGRVSVDLSRNGTRIMLVVRDNGVGLDAGISLERVSGFGLTIIRMLAEQLDGTFTVESENGTKAVFTFEM